MSNNEQRFNKFKIQRFILLIKKGKCLAQHAPVTSDDQI